MRTRSSPAIVCSLVLAILWIPQTYSQSLSGDTSVATAERVSSEVITVDGHLDEEEWLQAGPISDFRQLDPNEGASASQKTEVRILYGPNSIYIGAMLYDDNPEAIQARLGPRNELNQADWFIASIDSQLDRRTAFLFGVNAAGVQYDALRTGGGGGGRNLDTSWDAIWESAAAITDEGWSVEIRIPYSMLRFSNTDEQTWGIHFSRQVPRLGEETEWPLVPRDERSNFVAHFGMMRGIQGIEPRRSLQIAPYTLTGMNIREHPDEEGQPYREYQANIGGDVKVGITSNVTLDATINPDFGQVEADPAVMDLSAFETFFAEQRPFFVEGIQIYEFDLGRRSDLLYTRRIGAQAPIIGATKLSGRTGGALSFGVLGATTGSNFSPQRGYGIARVSQEFGNSSIGGIVTGFEASHEQGRRRSVTAGTDWDFRFLNNTYDFEGFAATTHRQVPNLNGEHETGFAGSAGVSRRQGTWTYSASVDLFDHRFNPNDVGMLRRNNYVRAAGGLGHQFSQGQPFGLFQRASLNTFNYQEWSYDNRLNQGFNLRIFGNATTHSFNSVSLQLFGDYLFGGYDLFETRGLDPWAAPRDIDFSFSMSSDQRNNLVVEPGAGINWYSDGGMAYELEFEADWNVTSRLSLTGDVGVDWERGVTAWSSNETFRFQNDQWHIGEISAPPSDIHPDDFLTFEGAHQLGSLLEGVSPYNTAGDYYLPIFGERDTRSIDFTLRSNFTLSPSLSLQFYGQLFLAKGRYENFSLLRSPNDMVGFDVFPKRDEFTLNSFQTNAVLRWEYLPGSNVYLVWSQGRRQNMHINPLAPGDPSFYDRDLSSQISETFGVFPNNMFMFKLDYTFLN